MSTDNNVIQFSDLRIIDVQQLAVNTRKIQSGLIAPSKEEIVREELADEHDAEPIKSLEDINRITEYLVENKRWRDNMLFIVGINFGLRVSDLRMIIFSDIINDDFTFKTNFAVFEKKTRNTRKRKRNRYITINNAVIEAVTLYLKNTSNVSLSDYLFRSQSRNGSNKNRPLDSASICRMLKGIARDLHIESRVSTHTLRKTFGYHQMAMSHHDNRKLLLLQKMFGHSSPMQTLAYIGITDEEIGDAYMNLNLGSKQYSYLVEAEIVEEGVDEVC